MASQIVDVKIQERYDTEANWSTHNPVLLIGEIAFSSDKNGQFKIGDGTKNWKQLSYNQINWASIIGRPSTLNPSLTTLTNQDLDTVTALGFYNAAGGNTVTHKPDNVSAFGLLVYKTAGGFTTQELTEGDKSAGKKWIRQHNGTSWSAWTYFYSSLYPQTDGSVLSNINAGKISTGTLAAARLPAVTRSNSTSTGTLGFGGSFPVLDSVTTDTYGRVTAVNTKTFTLPANPNTDTKNTAGSTNSSSKLFLIGATSQAANPQTYSHDTAYIGTDGCVYSDGKKVSVEGHGHSYLPLSGGTLSNTVSSTLTTGTFLAGNQGKAIINSTAAAGSYTMLAKMNSTNGFFTHGAYQDKYLLQYTAKATVDAETNSVTKSVTILDESGNSAFPGTVKAPTFSGSLSGTATKATQDASGNVLTTSYAASLTASGRTITLKSKSGAVLSTATTQDTTYPVYYKTITTGFVDAYRTQTKGNTSSGEYLAAIRNSTASVNYAPQHSSGMAWGMGDTHGYLMAGYGSPIAYIGGGNADKLNWVRQIAFHEDVTRLLTITVPSSGWSATAPYTQTISNASINATDAPIVSLSIPTGTSSANAKLINKAYACVDSAVTNDGSITLYCYNKKPVTDFIINVKGI